MKQLENIMKARPILFKPDMVRAILDGRKTQTRRIVKPQPEMVTDRSIKPWEGDSAALKVLLERNKRGCPYGAPSDLLWVRETWTHEAESVHACRAAFEDQMGCCTKGPYYLATESAPDTLRWKPSIYMPRWASRLTLEITDVRVERLQDISEDDARAEGLSQTDSGAWCPGPCDQPEWAFHELWTSINGEESWAANPWVWVIQFQPHHMNVDAFLRDQEVA